MADLLVIARRVRERQRGKREKREESPVPAAPPTFTPFSPFSPVPWDGRASLRLMEAADGLVERLGVSGLHPDFQNAAGRVVEAYALRNMELFTVSVCEFEELVRRLAIGRSA